MYDNIYAVQVKKEYNQAIDVLRLISILAVVLIHTTTKTLDASGLNVVGMSWSLFLNQISRFAVPLFFMISGFVLQLNYPNHTSYLIYLKKRFSKILVPYIFWSLIYILLVYRQPIKNIFYDLLSGEASYQLYFIPALLIIYLIFPFLHSIYKIITNKWSLMVLGILQIGFLYYDYYVKTLPFFYPVSIVLLNYLPFILGMWACQNQIKIMETVKRWKYLFGWATIILAVMVFWQGRERYLNTHNYLAFYSQWRPSVLIYSIFLAMVLFWILNKIKRNYWFIKKLAKLSFLVFFIHVAVIEVIWPWILFPLFQQVNTNFFGKIVFDPIFFTLTTGVSFGLAYLIQKLPVVKNVVG